MPPRQKSPFRKAMETTAIVSTLLTVLLTGLYLAAFRLPILLTLAITAGTVCYHFVMRLLVGHTVSKLAQGISPDARWFRPQPWEAPLYRFLRVRRWKGKIPTYNPSDFDLAIHSLADIVQTMCCSELVHEVIVLLSFLPLLLALFFGDLPVFLITSAAAAAVDSIFVILQRYNRPRLMRLMQIKR